MLILGVQGLCHIRWRRTNPPEPASMPERQRRPALPAYLIMPFMGCKKLLLCGISFPRREGKGNQPGAQLCGRQAYRGPKIVFSFRPR